MSANEIIPNLFLGDIVTSRSKEFMDNMNIKMVVNCTKNIPFLENCHFKKIRVPVDDNLEEEEIRNLELWSYETVYKLMKEYKEGRPIFIHCHAGMQRSPAVTAMFLMALYHMSVDQAKAYIRNKRPIAFFYQANFEKSMRGFERSLSKNLIEGIE